ncbi:unnamed protein product [Cyprideis torosa]|uniref:Uncharacterized protein n=1 Tax=Cyprideis torosa TaxID=163714 RepID=A0A7R8W7R5_9CRUS|nr:unnamed protein product [Cyprideis torosa]CAG0882453.1 unnamed protein product [Cyprideis torosa]
MDELKIHQHAQPWRSEEVLWGTWAEGATAPAILGEARGLQRRGDMTLSPSTEQWRSWVPSRTLVAGRVARVFVDKETRMRPETSLFIIGFLVRIPAHGDPSNLPHFLSPVENGTVIVGRNATLSCSVANLGEYKVAWVHVERKMVLVVDKTVAVKIPRFGMSYDPDQTNWRLHIYKATEEDKGRYMCQLNTKPVKNQVGFLHVVSEPLYGSSLLNIEDVHQGHAQGRGNDLNFDSQSSWSPRETRSLGYPLPVLSPPRISPPCLVSSQDFASLLCLLLGYPLPVLSPPRISPPCFVSS